MSELQVPIVHKPKNGDKTTVDPDIEISCAPFANVGIYYLSSLTEVTMDKDGWWRGRPSRSLVPKQHTFYAVHETDDDRSDRSNEVTFTALHH
jgi:hypothetical protein